ncbi:helix-turn-helix domain-containing protein [Paenibacillus swuensis]
MSRSGGYPAAQIFLCREGKGRFQFQGGEEMELGPSQFGVIPAGQPHTYSSITGEPWLLAFIGFGGALSERIAEVNGLNPFQAYTMAGWEPVWSRFESIWQLFDKTDGESVWSSSPLIYELPLWLGRTHHQAQHPVQADHPSVSNKAMRKAVVLMEEHYGEPILISDLAKAVGYSIQHFGFLFKVQYGVTPLQYLNRIRMNHATALLESDPNLPVSEVALRIGMENNYFTRAFKQYYGKPPGSFRKPSES